MLEIQKAKSKMMDKTAYYPQKSEYVNNLQAAMLTVEEGRGR
jgi:hypothetical protein